MKTNIYTLALVAIAAVVCSCDGRMSATAYNETIVAMHSEAADALNEKMELVFDIENTSKEEAQAMIDELTAAYGDDIAKLGEMKYPEAAADWHKATTELFVYVKDNVIPLFAETLNHEPESEEWYDVWNRIDDNNSTANDLEETMIDEQAKFAAAVGRTLKD